MICPKCGSEQTKVSNTRMRGDKPRRQRTCMRCRYIWYTVEVPEEWYRKKLLYEMDMPTSLSRLEKRDVR